MNMGGKKYTFGSSLASVNLLGDILERTEYIQYEKRVYRLLSKQCEALNSLKSLINKNVRETSLKMWHDRFKLLTEFLPEVIKTHIRCVETGIYRRMLKEV